jgi:nucleoside-diphosphate-sugar epimerase
MKKEIINSDLSEIYGSLTKKIDLLRGKSILITGGTGFFGIWLLLFLDFANTELNLKISVEVNSRNPDKFLSTFPQFLSKSWILWNKSDIRNFVPNRANFDFVIHGATTSASETFYGTEPIEKFSVTYDGTKRLLEQLKNYTIENFLFMSSGSVYGHTSTGLISENDPTAPLTNKLDASIGHGKRSAEFLCFATMESNPKININIARCFSFVGPYLPLDLHYAIGNFIKNALLGEPISLESPGYSVRSYLYVSDAISWLMQLLLSENQGEVFNVGSEEAITIKNLAGIFSSFTGSELTFNITTNNGTFNTPLVDFYVPNTSKIRNSLGVREQVRLQSAITRTIDAYGRKVS